MSADRSRWPDWLQQADISDDAQIFIEPDGRVVWEGGTWLGGTWEDGTWVRGTWEDGIWEAGWWHSGTWEGGTWKDGIWEYGLWLGGTWVEGMLWPDDDDAIYSTTPPQSRESER